MSEATETTETPEDDPQSLRSLLEAAIPEEGDTPVTGSADAQTEEAAEEPAQEAESKEPEPEVAAAPAEPEATQQRELFDEAHPGDAERYPNLTAERVEKAPSGWRPTAREGWDTLPEPVRREIHRREMDIQSGLQQSSEARQFQERFEKQVQPYQALIQAEGAADPLQAMDRMFATVATLSMGSAQQKAKRIAELVAHYKVDLNDLADAVDGGASPESQVPDPVRQALDARLAPLERMMGDYTQRAQQATQAQQAQMAQEVSAFGEKAEFFEDVRGLMADIWDLKSQQGQAVSLQEAYDLACSMTPQVRKVIEDRTRQQDVLAQDATTARKLAASATSRAPGSVGNGAARPSSSGDLHSDIAAAWDAVEGG